MIELTVPYVLSQILTLAEYGLLGASYLAKKRRNVVILDIVSMSCGIAAFWLLGADLGMGMSVIILLANFYYLWEDEISRRIALSKTAVAPSQGRKPSSVCYSSSSRTASEISSSFNFKVVRNILLAVVLMGIGVIAMLTYDGPLSLLSVAATVIYEVSIWQKSTKVYKFMGIPVALCWMTYNGFVLSVFGVVCEAVMLVTSIVGYVREVKSGKKKRVGKK